jgi:hypothetical protein
MATPSDTPLRIMAEAWAAALVAALPFSFLLCLAANSGPVHGMTLFLYDSWPAFKVLAGSDHPSLVNLPALAFFLRGKILPILHQRIGGTHKRHDDQRPR